MQDRSLLLPIAPQFSYRRFMLAFLLMALLCNGMALPSLAAEQSAPQDTPARLRIPAIALDTAVEAVGRTAAGAMAVPQDVDNVAWYELGPLPGQSGNAVIAGHLDRIGGAPAAFWDLDALVPGDDVYVVDGRGVEHHYQVTGVESYPYDKAPIAEIFGFSLESRLNLITCRGRWDHRRQTYSNRLVVYTALVEHSESPPAAHTRRSVANKRW